MKTVSDDEIIETSRGRKRIGALFAQIDAHADLVAALEFCAASFDPDTDALIQPRRKDMLSNIRAALAKAKA